LQTEIRYVGTDDAARGVPDYRGWCQVYANRFWTFIAEPKERFKLKTFFENARNYTIAVALITAGLILYTPAHGLLRRALVNARGWLRLDGVGLVHVNGENPRSRDRALVIQNKYQSHSGLDKVDLYHTFVVYGAL